MGVLLVIALCMVFNLVLTRTGARGSDRISCSVHVLFYLIILVPTEWRVMVHDLYFSILLNLCFRLSIFNPLGEDSKAEITRSK